MDRDPRPVEPGEEINHELPDDAYFQYAFIDTEGKIRPDPACPESTTSVWYGEVSQVPGPAYRPDPLAAKTAEEASGRAERFKVEPAVGEGPAWRVSVVSPPDTAEGLPLVIVQDGVAFFRMGRPHLIARELLALGEARPARFAFIEPHHRNREYGVQRPDSDDYQRFLTERLEPALTERFATNDERVYLGASLGAAASARAALNRVAADPALASATTVLAYSGAFLGVSDDADYYRSSRSWLLERLERVDEAVPARWQLEVGEFEWLLDVNRKVVSALEGRQGVAAELIERSAGHNWTSWRNGLASGLRFALAPKT